MKLRPNRRHFIHHRRYKVWCPVEGIDYFDDEVQRRWDGTYVGPNAELRRHPQEFLRVRAEIPPAYITGEPDTPSVDVHEAFLLDLGGGDVLSTDGSNALEVVLRRY